MKYKCPQCQKEIELSDDELLSQGNLIVCPACLSEFVGDPTKPHASAGGDTRQYVYSTPEPPQQSTVNYCRFCGAQLNGVCNFCPVCGNRLNTNAAPQQNNPKPAIQQTYNAPKQPAAAYRPPQVPYMPSYRHADFGQNKKPDKRKKAPVLAYLLIVLLVILLIYILH